MVYQHVSNYQPSQYYEHFNVHTYIAVTKNFKMHLFYHAVHIEMKLCADDTTQESYPLILNLLHMCPVTPEKQR